MSLTEQPAALPQHTKARLPAPKHLVLSAKLKAALREIVWNGKDIPEAARATGYKPTSLRVALAKQHVRRFLKEERDVFIAQAQGQNIFRAVRNADSDNAAASQRAVEFIERISDERAANAGSQAAPGIVIVIGDIAKALNQPANILELQAKALPCEGDTKPDGA